MYQGHAGELAARQHAVRVLHRGHGHVAPFHAGVGAAFDEMKTRDRRQAHQVVHGEYARGFDQAVDHETVFGRVYVPPALVMPLEMQTAGRDDAEQRLQRRERHRGLRGLRQARALTALQIRFKLRRQAIRFGSHALTKTSGVRRKIQYLWLTLCLLGLRIRTGAAADSRCRRKRPGQKIAPPAAVAGAQTLQV